MKNKKKNSGVSGIAAEEAVLADDEGQRPGILKSALKRGSKKYSRKKHRVQFDESLNKFFEADYVILVRDDEYDDDDLEDIEYGQCECGNQFCYEGCYYEDIEVDEDGDYRAEYRCHSSSGDSPRFDFAAPFDPPVEFVDPVTLSPPDGYKDAGCGTDSAPATAPNKVSASTMTSNDSEGPRKDGKSLFLDLLFRISIREDQFYSRYMGRAEEQQRIFTFLFSKAKFNLEYYLYNSKIVQYFITINQSCNV